MATNRDQISWISPRWPAPPRVRAVTTTRQGGYSAPPYHGLNLGDHVGDDPERVERNRALLARQLQLPARPHWLRQVHGCAVVEVPRRGGGGTADAAVATGPDRVCAVLTADCLPLLLCNRAGSRVAAVHAGWRGLAEGVIEAAMARLEVPGAELLVWLGPAIGPSAFEVGSEVRQVFVSRDPQAAAAFRPGRAGRWQADIYQLARLRLQRQGVRFVYGGEYCTVTDPERFFSYRRDGVTGRMASLIWLQS